MTYASHIIKEFKAVMEYIDKMKSKYFSYGLFVHYDIFVGEEGYIVVIEPTC